MNLFTCSNCQDTYDTMPMGGYCDNSMECTGADIIAPNGDLIPASY